MKSKQLGILTLLLIMLLPLIPSTCDPENVLHSKWLQNPVSVDGDVTFSNEWSDANKIEFTIGTNYGRSPPFYDVTLWAKNDADHLYLLYCIKFDFINYDLSDKAHIYYLIPDEVSGLVFSDKSVTGQLGDTYDLFNKTGLAWMNDLDEGGDNNVEGMGHFDGVFYWFELKKPLNSGDSLDWVFLLGETYGFADSPIDKEEHLCVGLRDHSEGYDLQTFIQLGISGPDQSNVQSVGGLVEDVPLLPVLASALTRIAGYTSILVLGAWLYLRRR